VSEIYFVYTTFRELALFPSSAFKTQPSPAIVKLKNYQYNDNHLKTGHKSTVGRRLCYIYIKNIQHNTGMLL